MRGLAATAESRIALGVGAAFAAATALVLVQVGPAAASLVALSPVLAAGVGYVVTRGQAVLYVAAIALPMIPLSLLGSQFAGELYPQDIIAALALAALIVATFLGRGQVPPVPHTPVLGWAYVFFTLAIATATLRGHYAHGSDIIGQSLRLVLYAVIVAGLIGMTAPRLHLILNWLFYSGMALVALVALFNFATGHSATDQAALSTGGTRVLGISTSIYCAGTLFLALLNLRLADSTRERVFHLAFAALGLFGVIVAFGRAVYVAVALVGFLFLVVSRRLRGNLASVAPLAAPLVILLAIGILQTAPQVIDSVQARIGESPESDANVQWRIATSRAVLEQFYEQPLIGVGFGRKTQTFITVTDSTTGIPTNVPIDLDQDPHNGYLYLLAGGGLVALGSFLLLLAVFAVDCVRRYRATSDAGSRLLVLWASSTLFVFLVNATTGTVFANPTDLLTIWALLVLPAVVGARSRSEDNGGGSRIPDRSSPPADVIHTGVGAEAARE